MKRRLIVAAVAAAAVGGPAIAASATASTPVSSGDHQLCIVLAKDPDHRQTQYYCIDYWGLPLSR